MTSNRMTTQPKDSSAIHQCNAVYQPLGGSKENFVLATILAMLAYDAQPSRKFTCQRVCAQPALGPVHFAQGRAIQGHTGSNGLSVLKIPCEIQENECIVRFDIYRSGAGRGYGYSTAPKPLRVAR